jgi:hypothetical protein
MHPLQVLAEQILSIGSSSLTVDTRWEVTTPVVWLCVLTVNMLLPFILAGKCLLSSSEGEIAVERAFTFMADSGVVLARRRRKGPRIFVRENDCRFITGTLSEGRLQDVVGGSHDRITTIAAVIAVPAAGSAGS